MDSLISTFHIDSSLLIAQIVNFALVVLVLYRFAVKPLRTLMQDRQDEITKGLTDAEANATLLAQTKEEYTEVINEARKKAHTIVEDAKKAIMVEREHILQRAKEDAEVVLAQGKSQLTIEKEKMIASAKTELADIVLSATEKVLAGSMTKTIDKSLVENALATHK